MTKAILLSVHPEWCAKIFSGEKTIELRKNAPNIPTPFKCYVYQTLPKYGDWNDFDGKVVGAFVCARIEPFSAPYPAYMYEVDRDFLSKSCLTYWDVHNYLGTRAGYGWHVADALRYEKPKELSEFKRWNRTEENVPCAHAKWLYEPCDACKECAVKRPPQSWMYVEELQ